MNHHSASNAERSAYRPITVHAPHEWDGIGQALRCAYGNHRAPPREIADVMAELDELD